jgi:hypothetical protein
MNLDGVVPAFGDLSRFPFWAGFAIIFGLGWVAILVATLVTRPESMSVLRKFYRDVRPIGFWGPVSAELPPQERESVTQHSRAELTACVWGVTFYFLLVLALFAALGGHALLAMGAGVSTVVTGFIFARLLIRPAYHARQATIPGDPRSEC